MLFYYVMYAIIEKNGKQYKVFPGGKIRVEKLPVENGSEIVLDKVLMISKDGRSIFGSPYVNGAKVLAIVEGSGKTRKILIYKQKPRKSTRKLRGHRQPYTSLMIKEILSGGTNGT
ncbi:MAG: 50S ribosomal protein L21 [Thermodesulfovibrionales bacterium]